MKKIALVIMAAGIGSRFGAGIKQLEPVGPSKEIIMDYSIHDALEAGFRKIVFIIRKDLEEDFKEAIGNRIEKLVEVAYVYQELSDIPEGFTVPTQRKKPWGTGQAILCCKGVVKEAFCVINADDYYGKEAFRKMYQFLSLKKDTTKNVLPLCMAGFILGNTLSENGGVTRGVCKVDEKGMLCEIKETHNIQKTNDGAVVVGEDLTKTPIDISSVVSMNMWGLWPSFLEFLEDAFKEFLMEHEKDSRGEFLLPIIIDQCIREKKASVKVLDTNDAWFGVTYQEDKETVKKAFRHLIKTGIYSHNLYK